MLFKPIGIGDLGGPSYFFFSAIISFPSSSNLISFLAALTLAKVFYLMIPCNSLTSFCYLIGSNSTSSIN